MKLDETFWNACHAGGGRFESRRSRSQGAVFADHARRANRDLDYAETFYSPIMLHSTLRSALVEYEKIMKEEKVA